MAAWAMSVAMLFVNCVSAQEKPNFSGEWTVTMPDSPTGFCGQQCTITQDETSLTVTSRAGQQKSTFKLDGTETTVAVAGGLGPGVVTTAKWDGNTLRISVPAPGSSGASASIVFSMNAGQMEVETSIPALPGGNGEVRRTKQTYKKK
jgi:hypothetical protein